MGIFDRFPSTKLNDINLDWILKKIRTLRGGTTNQVLAKASNADFDFKWISGGGGGTSNYDELANRPQINSVTLTGDLSASDLGLLDPAALASYRTASAQDTIDADKQSKITALGMLKGDGDGGVSAATAGTDYLAPAALNSYRTAAAQNTIDAAQDAHIAIIITGARPSMNVLEGQYVIVRGSMITGIVDGLYTAVNALSSGADVTAADLRGVSDGGFNDLQNTAISVTYQGSSLPNPMNYISVPKAGKYLTILRGQCSTSGGDINIVLQQGEEVLELVDKADSNWKFSEAVSILDLNTNSNFELSYGGVNTANVNKIIVSLIKL